MRNKLQSALLLIDIATILLVIIVTVFSQNNVLRITLGVPFILFFPGYTLVAALFPRRGRLHGIERLALGLVLSLVVTAFIGFILNYTPWGVRLYPVLLALAGFILAASLIVWYQRRRQGEETGFNINLDFNWLNWRGKSAADRVLFIILIAAVMTTIGIVSYAAAVPVKGERYTEFYILDSEGDIGNYPEELALGEEAAVVVGIINREREEVSYRVVALISGIESDEIGPVLLVPDAEWRESIILAPTSRGNGQKVEFILYKNGQSEPCLEPLSLWINVK
jgi:uncharacterized membrane protein